MEDPGAGKEPVHKIWIKSDPAVSSGVLKKSADLKIMIDLLNVEIADIPEGGCRNNIFGSLYLFGKVNSDIHSDFTVFNLLIIFRHLFHGISQRVVGDGEQLRVFPDTLDISGRCFAPVPKSLLDKISRVFGFSIII